MLIWEVKEITKVASLFEKWAEKRGGLPVYLNYMEQLHVMFSLLIRVIEKALRHIIENRDENKQDCRCSHPPIW